MVQAGKRWFFMDDANGRLVDGGPVCSSHLQALLAAGLISERALISHSPFGDFLPLREHPVGQDVLANHVHAYPNTHEPRPRYAQRCAAFIIDCLWILPFLFHFMAELMGPKHPSMAALPFLMVLIQASQSWLCGVTTGEFIMQFRWVTFDRTRASFKSRVHLYTHAWNPIHWLHAIRGAMHGHLTRNELLIGVHPTAPNARQPWQPVLVCVLSVMLLGGMCAALDIAHGVKQIPW